MVPSAVFLLDLHSPAGNPSEIRDFLLDLHPPAGNPVRNPPSSVRASDRGKRELTEAGISRTLKARPLSRKTLCFNSKCHQTHAGDLAPRRRPLLLGSTSRHPKSNKVHSETQQHKHCRKNCRPTPKLMSKGSQDVPQINKKTQKLKYAAGLGRASGKKRKNSKYIMF